MARKKHSQRTQEIKPVPVRVTAEQDEQLRWIKKNRGVAKSAILRRAVSLFLAAVKQDPGRFPELLHGEARVVISSPRMDAHSAESASVESALSAAAKPDLPDGARPRR